MTRSRFYSLAGVAALAGGVALVAGAGVSRADQRAAIGVPPSMNCGSTATATLRVRNQTRAAWPASMPLTLRASPAARTLGSPAVVRRLGSGAVRRSAYASFVVGLTAPGSSSLARPTWRLFRGKAGTRVVVGGPVQVFCDQGSGIRNKVLAGYQGWFSCADDLAPPGFWVHWFNGNVPDAEHATFDVWPDSSELTPDEQCSTRMTLPGGAPAVLFSSANPATVERHVSWMREYGIDGVFYQRFLTTLNDPALARNRDIVLVNLLRSAERNGRKVAVEWDLSGDLTGVRAQLRADWRHLVDDLHVTSSPAYLYDHGRPVVGIFGFGFTYPTSPSDSAGGSPDGAMAVLNDLHHPAEPRFAARVMGGVPTFWRTLINDSRPEPAWSGVYAAFDILEPWPVGRYVDDAGDDSFRSQLVGPDIALTSSRGQDYMPGIFPGFSWHNLFRNRGELRPFNEIPRRGGRFLWHQGWNLVDAGATSIFVAMFDEVDEGTAIFKAAPTPSQVPVQGAFLSLDADGEALPADWYLRVTGEIGRMLRHEIAVQPALPIRP